MQTCMSNVSKQLNISSSFSPSGSLTSGSTSGEVWADAVLWVVVMVLRINIVILVLVLKVTFLVLVLVSRVIDYAVLSENFLNLILCDSWFDNDSLCELVIIVIPDWASDSNPVKCCQQTPASNIINNFWWKSRKRDICGRSWCFHAHLHMMPLLSWIPSEICHNISNTKL